MFSVAVFPSLSWLTVFGCPSGLALSPSFFSFSVFVYARANIIMCLSFSSRVLRYKNLLCNASVIQCITKKIQGIRIICLVKVCLLALKGLLLHRNRERCGTSDSVTDLVKQTWEISLIVICTWYLTLAGPMVSTILALRMNACLFLLILILDLTTLFPMA